MTEPSELRRFAMQCMERAQALTDPDARAAWRNGSELASGLPAPTNELLASNSSSSKFSRTKRLRLSAPSYW